MASEYRAEVQQMIDACGAPAVGLIELGVKLGLEAAARQAALFSVRPNRSLHPDAPWEQMAPAAQHAAHVTAQCIGMEIEDLSPTDILKAKGGKP